MHLAALEKAVGHFNLWHQDMEGVDDDLLVEVDKLSKHWSLCEHKVEKYPCGSFCDE
jgi:hypothetical protein